MTNKQYLTTKEASQFISENFFPCAPKTLAKLRCCGGSPKFRKAGTKRIIYFLDDLITWAESKISKPLANTRQEVIHI